MPHEFAQYEEGLGERRDAVTGHCQPFARLQFIGKPAGEHFEQACRCFGNALNQADDVGSHAQHALQE